MANLNENAQWDAGIYQLETTDPVVGGPNGIDNLQAKQLANRTQYLKVQVETKAPLASPALTGVPTAPTAAAGTNTPQLATTEFVTAAITALLNAPPAALDTLNELANALGNDPNFATTITNLIAGKAPWSALDALITEAGLVVDHNTLTQVRDAVKRLSGSHVTTVTAADSPFQLTPSHAGLILVNAALGPVVLDLPASNALAALRYTIQRIDTTTNAASLNAAGGESIDGAVTHPIDAYAPLDVITTAAGEWYRLGRRVGAPFYWPGANPPAGSLKLNGAAVSRTAYKRLFQLLGTTYGAGDGATTFNLPDDRAEFWRALDDGRGVDTGRVLGSAQADAFKSHSHAIATYQGPTGSGVANTGTNTLGPFNVAAAAIATGGTETRPRNRAYLACITY